MYYNIKNIWFTYLPMPYYACVFIILFIFFQLDEIFLPSVFDIFFSIMALDIYIYV